MTAALLPDIPVSATPTPNGTEAAPKRRGGGPKTPGGKERSRRNAIKHGLRAESLLPDDLADAVAQRTTDFAAEFEPGTAYEEFLVGQMALASIRLERCAELSMIDAARSAQRASLCWESDQRMAVDELGSKLPKDPARVATALRRSRQGADWLIERWEALAEILESNGDWNEAQRRLAFDLLGVPAELREGSKRVPAEGDTAGLAALAAREVARLREDREAVLDALDEANRGMAEVGMPLSEGALTMRLRRYEAGFRRTLNWAARELRRARGEDGAGGEPAGVGGPGSESVPRPSLTRAAGDHLVARSVEAERRRQAAPPTPPPPPPPPAPPPAPASRPAPVVSARPSAALSDLFAGVPPLGYSTIAVSAVPAPKGQPRPAAPTSGRPR
jgi:hypothetical protein